MFDHLRPAAAVATTSDRDPEDQMLRDMFVTNAADLLDTIEEDLELLASQEGAVDDHLINKIFRSAHTIKGESGFIQLQTIGRLAHAIEGVLDQIRDHKLTPTAGMVRRIGDCFEVLRQLILDIDNSEHGDIDPWLAVLHEIAVGPSAPAAVAAKVAPAAVVPAPVVAPVAAPEPAMVAAAPVAALVAPKADERSVATARVLVVDDDSSARKLVQFRLGQLGLSCTCVATGDEAVQLMKQRFFHVAVLDINLAGESGIDLIRKLKAVNPMVQPIMLTGTVNRREVLASLESGAFDFSAKSADMSQLLDSVQTALSRADRWLNVLNSRY